MAFRLFKKSDLIAGVIVCGFMVIAFLIGALFAHKIGGQLSDSRGIISPTDPEHAHRVMMWRIGMFAGSAFSAVMGWLCYRGSRRVAD